ncbi:hypothetical protein V6C21_07005 [[Clostridium] cellulosi]|jgi:hypothetical protein
MAKIKFIVKELNKPSQLALSNLSRVVYTKITTTEDTYSAKDGTITKLNSAIEKTA